MQRIALTLGVYGGWLLLAVIGVMVAFQLHATGVFLGLHLVTTETFRPHGWTTDTIYGLSRFLFLVFGILWLGYVVFLEGYLRTGQEKRQLVRRIGWVLLALATTYGVCYFLLYILS